MTKANYTKALDSFKQSSVNIIETYIGYRYCRTQLEIHPYRKIYRE